MTSFTMPFNFMGHTAHPIINQQGFIPQYLSHVTDKKPIIQKNSVNQLGGVFTNGKPLPDSVRHEIIRMSQQGVKSCEISKQLKVSHGCISKILSRYHATGSLKPSSTGGSKAKVATDEVISAIVDLKKNNPDVFAREILENVINRGLCSKDNAPSISSVNRILRKFSLGNNRMTTHDSLSSLSQFSSISTENQRYAKYEGSEQQTTNVTLLRSRLSNRPGTVVKRKAEDDDILGNISKMQKTNTFNTLQSLLNGAHESTDERTERSPLSINNGCTESQMIRPLNGKSNESVNNIARYSKLCTSTINTEEVFSLNTDALTHQNKPKDDFHTKVKKLQPNGFPYFHHAMGWMNLIPVSYETMADLGLPTSIMTNSSHSIFYDGPIPGESSAQRDVDSVQRGTVKQTHASTEKQLTGENTLKSFGNSLCVLDLPKENTFVKGENTKLVKTVMSDQMNNVSNVPDDINFQISDVSTRTSRTAFTNSCRVETTVQEVTDDSFSDDSFSERLTINFREECHESVLAVDRECVMASDHESVLTVDLSDVLQEELEESGSSLDYSSDIISALNTPSSPPFEQAVVAEKVRKELFPSHDNSL